MLAINQISLLLIEQTSRDADAFSKAFAPYAPQGMRICHAIGVKDALRVITEQQIDFIVMRTKLGADSGFDFCKYLRSNPKLKHTPIIMFETAASAKEKVQGFISGADDFIVLPIDMRLFLSRMKLLLKIKSI